MINQHKSIIILYWCKLHVNYAAISNTYLFICMWKLSLLSMNVKQQCFYSIDPRTKIIIIIINKLITLINKWIDTELFDVEIEV